MDELNIINKAKIQYMYFIIQPKINTKECPSSSPIFNLINLKIIWIHKGNNNPKVKKILKNKFSEMKNVKESKIKRKNREIT